MKIKTNFSKLFLILSVFFCVSIMPLVLVEDVNAELIYEFQVLDLVNNERTKIGVAPLEMDTELFDAAHIRAKEVSVFFSHSRPNGLSYGTVTSKPMGENIAAGYATPKNVVNGWMNSKGHRENMLNPNYKSIGVGYFKDACWVQLFWRGKSDDVLSPIQKTQPKTSKDPALLVIEPPSFSLTSANKKIIIKWKKVSDASKYQIYKSTKKNGKYALIKTMTKGNTFQYTDKVLKKEKFYYKIRSYIELGGKKVYSKFSAIKSKTQKIK